MPSTDRTEKLEAAVKNFRERLLTTYELEDQFIDSVCDLFRETATPLLEVAPVRARAGRAAVSSAAATTTPAAGAEAVAAGKPAKKGRKKSAYNVYVREMMKTTEIQSLDHKMKMSAIATEWKKLDTENKAVYTNLANAENDTAAAELKDA